MATVDAVTMKHVILSCLWLDYVWEQYMCCRQYKKTSSVTEVPNELKDTTSKKTFELAKQYTLDKKQFHFVKDHVNIIITTMIIHFDILPMIWKYSESVNHFGGEILTGCIWYLISTALITAINLPLNVYDIFVIEENCKLKRNDFSTWNKLKTFVVSQIFITVLSSMLVSLIQSGDKVFVATWLTFCLVVFFVGIIYPMMAPSKFRTHIALDEGELRSQIEELARQFHFPLKEIYVEEHFKCAPPQSIYFYGSPQSKSIVLFDSLFPKEEGISCSYDEILALLTQEFGRWHHNHGVKYVLAMVINLLLSFGGFFYLFKHPEIYRAFGFSDAQPILVGVYVVLKYAMVIYSTLLSFVFTHISRSFVFRDDSFAVRQGKGKALISALVRLDQKNLTFPVYDRLYSAWHNDKPSLLERIDEIKMATSRKTE
ncbi:CAAX prenyl protease 1 -like [Asbolus verrucosus]|uniref:CAAX prenyl protease n=1 Tax=Asbolus verrucosus TaxID=1661398 RepID=A0A482VDF6_ASBVE|nr:CAAX prenyl protease 1 -like [Asbolus verrucosus]